LNGLFDFDNFERVPSWYHHFDWGPSPAGSDSSLPDAITVEEVERFLETRPSEPFFVAAGIYKPHLPWHAPGRFFDMHPRDQVILPIVRDDDLDDAPPLARSWALNPPDHELVTSRGVWKDAVQGYLACISYADELVGRMIAALDRSAFGQRTAIVLCGDNGFHLGEKLHWRKFALWEEATRVPLIFVSPSGAPGTRVNEPVSLLDVYPTVLTTAGLSPDGHDAFDLSPLMTNGGNAHRPRPPITTWQPGNHSIRTRRWRFTHYVDGGRELFDHSVDPREWTNLANRPEYETVSAELAAQIDDQCGLDQNTTVT
jgi:arylsulfatase A-like enzyme